MMNRKKCCYIEYFKFRKILGSLNSLYFVCKLPQLKIVHRTGVVICFGLCRYKYKTFKMIAEGVI